MSELAPSYVYKNEHAEKSQSYLWGPVIREVGAKVKPGGRVFDLGCGNGALARQLSKLGYEVHGVDPSEGGIAFAQQADPSIDLQVGNAYDDLASKFGTFPCLVSLEVVEHVYSPRKFARCVHDLLEPGGTAVITTPYNGYWKNIALAVTGKMDSHFTALWDHGHIKFWSVKTLSKLFAEQGMSVESVHRVGRIPPLAKSMILVFRKAKN